ncbi:hypothetical protein M8C21_018983 [Ambrosia artemisiifolia]|uniref:Cyclin-dependent kinase inhibitor n=1 Tax=Ambrosia artemisiifolia TaxID=4212 RepID=A0AAD5GAD2_AMBAR|nr:hypothetical protein M8C21_018983 [Ambrosia artemisiifolia]
MGKYMRKPKLTKDTVTIIDVSQSFLGVRTRAKTLALQKQLQAALKPSTLLPPSTAEQQPESCYLQLRNRRLQKPLVEGLTITCCRQHNTNTCYSVGSGSVDQTRIKGGGEIDEGCFGGNDLDFDCRERSTRESTPCSSIKDLNVINTLSNFITRSMPMSHDIEEFFALHEQEQHKRFADKYNFNFVDEKPLEGCYEWV